MGRKPWPEHEGHWGDPDGDDNSAYEVDPGEQSDKEPSGDDPDADD